MKLDAWLKQDQPLEERLRVIERLCQAVNEVHDRGDVVGALEPGRIDVGDDGHCDLSAVGRGLPRPPYAAPENGQAGPALADIYAAGAISWEILAGRSVGRQPAHLVEVRPELQRELADAVMACLEQSPDWRPNDLTYLAQMAAARQRATGGRAAPPARAPLPPRSAPKPSPRRGPSRRTWPLLAALVVVLGLGVLAARQYLGESGTPSSSPTAPPPTPAPTPAPPSRVAMANPGAGGEIDAIPATPPSEPAALVAAKPLPLEPSVEAPVPKPPEAPEPATPARPAPEETRTPPPRTTTPAPPPVAPPAAPAVPTEPPASRRAPVAESSAPTEVLDPAVLSALAPPSVRRPGKVLVDLRGSGLHPQHRARVLPVKKVPRGITVVRQKHVSDTLITILLQLEDTAEPGEYAIAVEDGRGTRSTPLIFTVTK